METRVDQARDPHSPIATLPQLLQRLCWLRGSHLTGQPLQLLAVQGEDLTGLLTKSHLLQS
jgi:hypothetical protein